MIEEPYFEEVVAYSAALYTRFADSVSNSETVLFDSGELRDMVNQYLDEVDDAEVSGGLSQDFATQLIDKVGPGFRGISSRIADLNIDAFESRYPETARDFQEWYELSALESAVLE